MTRCLACRQLERERGSYRHERDGKVLDLFAAGWSHRQIARELPIARATVDRIRARLGVPPRSAPPIEPTHPGVGTMEGFQYHERHKEALCPACHTAHDAYLRDRDHGRKEGRPGAGRQPPSAATRADYRPLGRPRQPIVHGTAAGYSAHRKQHEAQCDACLAARRAANRRYAAKTRAARPPARLGRPAIFIAPEIVTRVLTERSVGQSYAVIAAGFMADGIPPPGTAKRWYPGTVRTIEMRATPEAQ